MNRIIKKKYYKSSYGYAYVNFYDKTKTIYINFYLQKGYKPNFIRARGFIRLLVFDFIDERDSFTRYEDWKEHLATWGKSKYWKRYYLEERQRITKQVLQQLKEFNINLEEILKEAKRRWVNE